MGMTISTCTATTYCSVWINRVRSTRSPGIRIASLYQRSGLLLDVRFVSSSPVVRSGSRQTSGGGRPEVWRLPLQVVAANLRNEHLVWRYHCGSDETRRP